MTLSPILPTHDADTVSLRVDMLIAQMAYDYRTSQGAIASVIVDHLAPVREEADDRPLTPDAVERLLKAIDEIEPTPSQPELTSLALAADASPPAKVDAATDRVEPSSSRPPAPSVAPIHEPAAPAINPVKPTGPLAKHAVEAPTSAGRVHDRCESTPPTPHPNGQPMRRTTGRTAALIRIHAEHPDWPASKIAKAIGTTRDVIHAAASKRGIKLPSQLEWEAAKQAAIRQELSARADVETLPAAIHEPAPTLPTQPKPPTRREQFRQAHAAHPEWTSKEHAAHLGISMENVCAVATQIGITLPRAGRTKSEQAPVTTPRPAPSIPAQRVGPPAVTARLPVTAANEPRRVVPTHAPRGAGPGVRFNVRDAGGRWLHQSLEASPTDDGPLMTFNRAYAWCDTAQRFAGACRKWPEINSMRKVGPTDV